MKQIKFLFGILFMALTVVSCEYTLNNKNVVLEGGDKAYAVDNFATWSSAGGAAAECASIGGGCNYSWKIEGAAPNGTVATGNGAITISNSNGYKFDWSISPGYEVCAVIVKAGTGAAVYRYDGVNSDAGLIAPGGKQISHVTFCFGESEVEDLVIAFKSQMTSGWACTVVDGYDAAVVDYYDFVPDYTGNKIYYIADLNQEVGNIVVSDSDSDGLWEVTVTSTGLNFIHGSYLFVGTLEQYLTSGSPFNWPYQQVIYEPSPTLTFQLPF